MKRNGKNLRLVSLTAGLSSHLPDYLTFCIFFVRFDFTLLFVEKKLEGQGSALTFYTVFSLVALEKGFFLSSNFRFYEVLRKLF